MKRRDRDRLYGRWRSIMMRCKSHPNYVKQKITVVKRWQSFETFQRDMRSSFERHCIKHGEPMTSLDRIDNAKGYSKKNCRWIRLDEQQRNRRFCRVLTHARKTMLRVDWAKELGISPEALGKRIDKYGWSIKRALTTTNLRKRKL